MWLRPEGIISNFQTAVSGVTQALYDAHQRENLHALHHWLDRRVGPNTIIIAHAHTNDHLFIKQRPHRNTLDTQALFDHPDSPDAKCSLNYLVSTYLGALLDRSEGHCSVDDARACIELVRYVLSHGEHISLPALGRAPNLSSSI